MHTEEAASISDPSCFLFTFSVGHKRVYVSGYIQSGALEEPDRCPGGKPLQTLDERGLTENTIAVFTSDHGAYLSEH
ncbi:hypothetical protein GC096_06100 [Paenibacillus sp. LMG 31461]|uniref:Sulfatase N-terminal domain-containing protein n=1 Tax=Paenibacillus plantarum TaxID=2654975 RepID=A0ABX1X586_9BACL|nr:hypothetical protein [Paenibacillus plantarum]NOU63595.1 hypothetical protein [Paenibacillus plantarum]